MNKDNILYGIIGLLAGLIIGYLVTDRINTSAPAPAPNAGAMSVPPGSAQPGAAQPGGSLPADHPPAGGATGAPQADVMATIGKARQEPGNFKAQLEAANLFYQIQSFDKVGEFIDRAAQNASQAKPEDLPMLTALGNTAYDTRHFNDAARWYELALRLKPDDVNLRTDLGSSYMNSQPRNLDKAIEAYRTSLKSNPRHEATLYNLTSALIEKGDKAAARDTLKQLEQVNPNNQGLAQLRSQLSAP